VGHHRGRRWRHHAVAGGPPGRRRRACAVLLQVGGAARQRRTGHYPGCQGRHVSLPHQGTGRAGRRLRARPAPLHHGPPGAADRRRAGLAARADPRRQGRGRLAGDRSRRHPGRDRPPLLARREIVDRDPGRSRRQVRHAPGPAPWRGRGRAGRRLARPGRRRPAPSPSPATPASRNSRQRPPRPGPRAPAAGGGRTRRSPRP